VRLIERVRRRVGHGRREPDPFATLELQNRLTRLSRELDTLASRPRQYFALAHHAEAATRAYEMTLAEACRLMGIPCPEGDRGNRVLLMEADLARAGWSW
jgi:hypothetical protein